MAFTLIKGYQKHINVLMCTQYKSKMCNFDIIDYRFFYHDMHKILTTLYLHGCTLRFKNEHGSICKCYKMLGNIVYMV